MPPPQSPVVVDSSTATPDPGWGLPTSPTNPGFSVALTRESEHNNYYFVVTPTEGAPPTVQWANITWAFKDFHFHVPAEHVVVGQTVSILEMHVKAIGTLPGGGKYSGVFAVQFALSNSATAMSLAPVANALSGQSGQTFALGTVLSAFTNSPVFHYVGSLTTPPCGTPVTFFVLQYPILVDAASWQTITSTLVGLNNGVNNVRPLQPTPGPAVVYLQP